MARTDLKFNFAAESDSFELLRGLVLHTNLVSFQSAIGTMPQRNKLGLVAKKSDARPQCWSSASYASAISPSPPRCSPNI